MRHDPEVVLGLGQTGLGVWIRGARRREPLVDGTGGLKAPLRDRGRSGRPRPTSRRVPPPSGRVAGRQLTYGIAAVGLALGCLCYLPAAVRFDDWVQVCIVNHSIWYDFSALPTAQAALAWVWHGRYVFAVCWPLLTSRDRRLWFLGLGVAVSAVISHVLFWYAFASVWCFFAAALSIYICYVLYALSGSAPTSTGFISLAARQRSP